MPVLAEHVIAPVTPHATVFVTGGGGGIQPVPWNLPADGDVRVGNGLGDGAVFGGFGALTEVELQKLAERIKAATFSNDVQAILEIVPTIAERHEVAARAIAIGADAGMVQLAMQNLESDAATRQWLKPLPMPVRIAWSVLSTASFAACVYHGIKRHHGSVWWGLGWGIMGAMFPVVMPVIAFARKPGFAKPLPGGLARRRRRWS